MNTEKENQKRTSMVFILCGGCGAGKTTYAIDLAARHQAIRFSIDPWMQTLFSPDQKGLDFAWTMERIERCRSQIWELVEQLIKQGIHVVLDLGFDKKDIRQQYRERIREWGANPSIHFLDVPTQIRRERVRRRNEERNPAHFSFEVTDAMFDFVEPLFEAPDEQELVDGLHIVYPTG